MKKCSAFFLFSAESTEDEKRIRKHININKMVDNKEFNELPLQEVRKNVDSKKNMTIKELKEMPIQKIRKEVDSNKNNKEFKEIPVYRGFKLNVNAIRNKVGKDVVELYHDTTASKQKKKTRIMIKCLTCEKSEEDARRMSQNASVYAAHGI